MRPKEGSNEGLLAGSTRDQQKAGSAGLGRPGVQKAGGGRWRGKSEASYSAAYRLQNKRLLRLRLAQEQPGHIYNKETKALKNVANTFTELQQGESEQAVKGGA